MAASYLSTQTRPWSCVTRAISSGQDPCTAASGAGFDRVVALSDPRQPNGAMRTRKLHFLTWTVKASLMPLFQRSRRND
jgi:hypothetical protein